MPLREGELPTVDNCDRTNPEEAWLPALIAIPGIKGAPMPWPVEYLKVLSKRLWDFGGPPDPDAQTVWYHPPRGGDISPMFAAGQYKDHPPEETPNVDITSLSKAMQDELRRQALALEGPPAPTEEGMAQESAPPKWPEKIKVHYLAKKLGYTSRQVIDICSEIGVPVKTAQSSIPGNRCAAIRDQLRIKAALDRRNGII